MSFYLAVFSVLFVGANAHVEANSTINSDAFLVPTTESEALRFRNLPEIPIREPCEAGKVYKRGCNICKCSPKNVLMCTKKGCHKDHRIIHLQSVTKKNKNNNGTMKDIKKEFVEEDIVLDANKLESDFKNRYREPKPKGNSVRHGNYSPLPKGECVPGRVYKNGCKRCLCNDRKKPVCSVKDYCLNPDLLIEPEDVIPPVEYEQYKELVEIPDHSAACTPGQTVRVDCNVCICDESENLVCDHALCLNPVGTLESEAHAKSGMPCTYKDVQESSCIRCVCNKKKTQCEAVKGCVSDLEKTLRSLPVPRRLDWRKEKCRLHAVYSDNCNTCYCTSTGGLRCTEKQCMKHSEVVQLQHDIELMYQQEQD